MQAIDTIYSLCAHKYKCTTMHAAIYMDFGRFCVEFDVNVYEFGAYKGEKFFFSLKM